MHRSAVWVPFWAGSRASIPPSRRRNKVRRLFACLTLCASLCHAQESYDRLAATVKLWNYVKYLHPRATSPGVDWNTAFAKAAPKVLSAGTAPEMSGRAYETLCALREPAPPHA